jgi:hypothetical protein
MELDKKALAVARLVSAIHEWDPRQSTDSGDAGERKKAMTELINRALPEEKSKQNMIDMILAMTLLTSGNVESVRNPEGFNPKKAKRWTHFASLPTLDTLKVLGYPSYMLVTAEDYARAKKLLPIIGSSSMLEAEVYTVFSKSGLPDRYPELARQIDAAPDKKGIGGYDQLHRGLAKMSDAGIARLTNLSKPWDMTRGVSTSRNYSSAKGFSQKGPNHVLITFDNPRKTGYNALKMSRFGREEEVILSGVAEIENYQLTFYAKETEEDEYADGYMIQVTPSMIFIRKGSKPIYGNQDLSDGEAHAFVKRAMSGKPFEITRQDGAKITLITKPKTSTIDVFGKIK